MAVARDHLHPYLQLSKATTLNLARRQVLEQGSPCPPHPARVWESRTPTTLNSITRTVPATHWPHHRMHLTGLATLAREARVQTARVEGASTSPGRLLLRLAFLARRRQTALLRRVAGWIP